MRKRPTVSVRVLAPGGEPVAGASLIHVAAGSKPSIETADAAGRWEGAIGRAGQRAWLAAWSGDSAPACWSVEALPADVPPLVLRLQKPAGVEVTLHDSAGTPIGGNVELRWITDRALRPCLPAGVPTPWDAPRTIPQQEEGRWALRGIAPGFGQLEVRARGFLPKRVPPAQLNPGQTLTLGLLELVRGATLEGFVKTPEGEPAEGVRVAVRRNDTELDHTVTDASGRFALAVASGDTVDLVVGRWPGAVKRLDDVRPKEAPLEIELAPDQGIAGRVTNGEGDPIADAVVQALPVKLHWRWAEEDDLREARSDPEGRFRLGDLAIGRWRVRARAARYAPTTVVPPVAVDADETTRHDIVLRAGVRLEGRVLDSSGEPVGSASVREEAGAGPRPAETVSAEDGTFRLEGLRRGAQRIEAEHPDAGWGFIEADPADGPVEIVLQPTGTVEGRATSPDGEPLVGRTVVLDPIGKRTQTDSDGSFRLERLPPGRYRVSLWETSLGDRRAIEARTITLEAGDVVEILFDGRGAVHGTFSVNEVPVARARVTLTRLEGRRAGGNPGETAATVATESDGSYGFDGLRPGMYVVSGSWERLEASRTIHLSEAETRRADLVVRGTAVEGTVRDDSDDAPIRGARVDVFDPRRTWGISRHVLRLPDGSAIESVQLDGAAVGAVTDHAGRFRLFVPEGKFRFEASAENYRSRRRDLDVGEEEIHVELRLTREYHLRGVVLGEFGAPRSNAALAASCLASGTWVMTSSDADGGFEMDGLVPGPCAVVFAAGRSAAVLEADPGAAGESWHEVQLQPVGSLRLLSSSADAIAPRLATLTGIPLDPLLSGAGLAPRDALPRKVEEEDRVTWTWEAVPAGVYRLEDGPATPPTVTITPGAEVVLEGTRR